MMKPLKIAMMATALTTTAALAADKAAVVAGYANIAHAGYEDSLTTAKTLHGAVGALIANPTAEALTTARDAWLASRVPY